MIEIVGVCTIPAEGVYAIIIFGIITLIQPYSLILKSIGFMIGMGAYALLPLAIVG